MHINTHLVFRLSKYSVTSMYNAIKYNAIKYNEIKYNAIKYNAIKYNAIKYKCSGVLVKVKASS